MHWAISDLHGQLSIWRQVEQILKPGEDTIVVLGDCVDRGPYPFQTLKEVCESPLNPTILLGNHEDTFVDALLEMHGNNGKIETPALKKQIYNNTTDKTIAEWKKLTNGDYSWIWKILDFPIQAEYYNEKLNITFQMTHSGYIPAQNPPTEEDRHLAIWDRKHIFHLYATVPDNTIIVHGHTIIPYVKERMFWDSDEKYKNRWEITEPFIYCQGKKIDIDACSFATNKGILLNLDTLDSIILDAKPLDS